jgi:hypothetical protein
MPVQIAAATAVIAGMAGAISAIADINNHSGEYRSLRYSTCDYAQMAVDLAECDRILDAARRMPSPATNKVAEAICEQRSQLMMQCSMRNVQADLHTACVLQVVPSDLLKMMFVDDGFTVIAPTAQLELDDEFVMM